MKLKHLALIPLLALGFNNVASAQTVMPPSLPESVPSSVLPGTKMEDGTVFVGIVPYWKDKAETIDKIYTTPNDAPYPMEHERAANYCLKLSLDAHLGHRDWRLPTPQEQDKMSQNQNSGALRGTFNQKNYERVSWYWSAFEDNRTRADAMQILTGNDDSVLKTFPLSVRCVRAVPEKR